MAWMSWLPDIGLATALVHFIARGGPVLYWLAGLIFVFWLIAIERLLYLFVTFPKRQKICIERWRSRDDHHSWYAQKQRDAWLNRETLELYQYVNILRLMVALFPLLGLLGTVTGMINVFDLLSQQAMVQPRLLASGISMATLPTLAGLVAALSGLFFYARLTRALRARTIHLEKRMRSQA